MVKKKLEIKGVELIMKEGLSVRGYTDLGDGDHLEYSIVEKSTIQRGNYVSCSFKTSTAESKSLTYRRKKCNESKILSILIDSIKKNFRGFGSESSRSKDTKKKKGFV